MPKYLFCIQFDSVGEMARGLAIATTAMELEEIECDRTPMYFASEGRAGTTRQLTDVELSAVYATLEQEDMAFKREEE